MATIQKKIAIAGLSFLTLFFVSCTKNKEASSSKRELRVFSWSSYLVPKIVENFESKYQVKVKTDYFSSNEELLAKVASSIQASGRGYDVIIPSDYMVSAMKKLGYLHPLDHSKMGVLKEFDETFLKPKYDSKLEYSIPFAFGTTGIAVNTKLAKNFDLSQGVSWQDLFDTKKFQGKVTLLDDSKEVFHAALLVLKKSWASATEADLKEAFEFLRAHKKNIAMFTPETRPVLENGECVLCQAYSGDSLQVSAEHPELKYFIPKEGSTLWTDNLAIPKNAVEVELAHLFINEVLSAESAKKFTEESFFASPNKVAMALVDAKLKSNPAFLPDAVTQKKLSYLDDRPEILPVIDKYWTELRAE